MAEINVKLDVFEGPLDLLLHLIKTLEIDIYDIPIAEITEQYLSYIHTMEVLHLDVAGEYLVMAATLMAIKSKLLIPIQEIFYEEDEYYEVDPREELVQQLLEYRKFKYAAQSLQVKESERANYFTKEPSDLSEYQLEEAALEPLQLTTIDLFLAFHNVLEKQVQPVETKIVHDKETIEDKIEQINATFERLPFGKGVPFGALFINYTKAEVVTTFLAILELVKERAIRIEQTEIYGEIILFKNGEIVYDAKEGN